MIAAGIGDISIRQGPYRPGSAQGGTAVRTGITGVGLPPSPNDLDRWFAGGGHRGTVAVLLVDMDDPEVDLRNN